MRALTSLLALSSVLLTQPSVSLAEGTSRDLLSKAESLYKERGKPGKIDEVIALLVRAEENAPTDEPLLKFDIAILHSRSVYFKGVYTTSEQQKIALFERGIALADVAKALSDEYSEGYYYHALNLARWGEVKGAASSFGRKQEMLDHLSAALARVTRPNSGGEYQAGETVDGYGPDRILGRIYFKLPGSAGGSREKSLFHLRRAHSRAPTLALNHYYLAETLSSEKSGRREAIEILDSLLSANPAKFNLERVPETQEEFALARKLRSELN